MSDAADITRLSARSIGAAYTAAAPMLAVSSIAGAIYLAHPGTWPGVWAWLALAPLIALTLTQPVWRWAFTRVDLSSEGLRVRTGFVHRRDRQFRWQEIVAVDARQSWALRLWRVHEISLSQSGDERTRVHLEGVSDDGRALVLQAFARAQTVNDASFRASRSTTEVLDSDSIIYRSTVPELLVASLVYGQFALLGTGAVFASWDLLEAAGVAAALGQGFAQHPLSAAVLLATSVMLIGLALTIVRFARFEVRSSAEGGLTIRYGVVSTHRRHIDTSAVAGVVLHRNLIESALGRVRLSLLTNDSAATLGTNLILPSLRHTVVDEILRTSFPTFDPVGPYRWGSRRSVAGRVLVLVLTLSTAPLAWQGTIAAGWPPIVASAAAACALAVIWVGGRFFCGRLRVDPSARVIELTTTHVVQRRRILAMEAVHVMWSVAFLRRPALVAVAYVAGTPRVLRSARFEPSTIRDIESALTHSARC